MDKMRSMAQELLELWRGWPPARRAVALASLAAGSLAFLGILAWATRQHFVPLMTNLSEEDAQRIVGQLQADEVPYRLAAGGTTVMVPEERVHQLRLKVAGEGLPRGGNVGFEMFDSPSFGMSHFAEQLNYHRALEGELRRTIRQLDAVREARVHIVVPERSFFSDNQQATTASITLQMHPGRRLGPQQTQAVVHLVSSAVAGLSPQQVTVIDEAGNILAKGGGEGAHDLAGGLQRQQAVERSLEDRVQQLLQPVVGAGHAVVKVAASLDFSHSEKTREHFDPEARSVRSEQINEEHHGGKGEPSGIPGSRSNLAGVQEDADVAGGSERRMQTRNFEVSKIVEREIGQLGRLARLSVAVLVNGVEAVAADGSRKMSERSEEELGRIEELVRRAVGFDADREDQIVVSSMLFAPPAEEPAVAGYVPALAYAERMWRPALLTVVALVLLGVMVKRGRDAELPLAQILEMPRTVRELEAKLGQATDQPRLAAAGAGAGAAGEAGEGAGATVASILSPQQQGGGPEDGPVGKAMAQLPEHRAVARSLANFKRPEPARAANVLKSWLGEA